jgi:GAF domain-containing protein
MDEQTTNWKQIAENEIRKQQNTEQALTEMRRFLFDYFYLLGPDPRANMSIVVDTLGKVLGSAVALYNRLESGMLKTWCIDNEPEGFKREDSPEGHICYNMTIRQHDASNIEPVVLNNLEGTEWETLDDNVRVYGLKAYLGFPILLENEVVGSLCVVDTETRDYSVVELYIIEAFASAIRLEEERLLTQTRLAQANEDLKRKNKEIETLALTDSLILQRHFSNRLLLRSKL